MTTEERLVDALHAADSFEPSPDLFSRLQRSIEENRAHRRRVLLWSGGIVILLTMVVTWVAVAVEVNAQGRATIESWRLVVAYLAVAGGLVVGLGPHLRRFGSGFLEGVFFLDTATGRDFIRVLDVAYYAVFAGLILVDADHWNLGQTQMLQPTLETHARLLAVLLLVMGLLHVANLIVLPILGLVFNSTVRREERRSAGAAAPPESVRARIVDGHGQTIAIVVLVLALALMTSFVVGGPAGFLLDLFE